MSNPLLNFQYRIPFDDVRAEHVQPAIEELLSRARERLDALIADRSERTYDNTLEELDAFTEPLEYAMNIVRHLENVATTPELRKAYNAVQPKVTAFYSSLPLNEGLWNAIKKFAATAQAKSLTGTRARFLKKTVDNFKRHGAELDPAGKERLKEIDVELSRLTTKYSENVLDSTNEFELVLHDQAQLAGLPPTAIAAARESAASKNTEGWRFTLHAPSYLAVMTYLDDPAIRRDMYRAYGMRASSGDRDNRGMIVDILRLRNEKAHLLGFRDFAGLVLEDRMAHTGERAQQFIEELRAQTEPYFEQENRQLREFAGRELDAWDVAYYAEKQRKDLYDFDEEALRPYFPLDRVVAGMFEIFGRVLGIQVKEQPGVSGWDPQVKFYTIEDESGHRIGGFYTDWFPRDNKRAGAWMDVLITGLPSVDPDAPHLGMICGNLTPPIGDNPALLTHREVETIFHEFGHLLHHCLSRVEVRGLAGTNVAWDFVELPSQIMENWCWERESLDLFARHYQTGERLPDDLFEKMRRAKTFRAANMQMRQLGFGFVDLALHREYSPERDGDVVDYARHIIDRFSPARLPDDHAMIASFTHLFGSPIGYGAGYYSYKWAEVLDADAFTRFKREGIFNREVGREYRERILAKGDSEDPAELYRSFMGRDPDPHALLERAGLVAR
jgi:oligopeptidase A